MNNKNILGFFWQMWIQDFEKGGISRVRSEVEQKLYIYLGREINLNQTLQYTAGRHSILAGHMNLNPTFCVFGKEAVKLRFKTGEDRALDYPHSSSGEVFTDAMRQQPHYIFYH